MGTVSLPGEGDEAAITRSDPRQQPATACSTVVRRRIGYNLEGEAQGVPLRAWVVLWLRPVVAPAERSPGGYRRSAPCWVGENAPMGRRRRTANR